MKVPASFRLAGIDWRVVHVEGLDELGRCDRDTQTIYLRKGLPKQTLEATFCHELLHAIWWTTGRTDHDEREIDAAGYLLHQFLTTAR